MAEGRINFKLKDTLVKIDKASKQVEANIKSVGITSKTNAKDVDAMANSIHNLGTEAEKTSLKLTKINLPKMPSSANVKNTIDSQFREVAESIHKMNADITKLETSASKVYPMGTIGTYEPNVSLFSSFSKLVDTVNDSVPIEKLNKFQTIAKSLRSFTSSLNDIIAFNKSYGAFSNLVKNLKSEQAQQMREDFLDFIRGFNVNMENGSEFSNGFKTLDKFTGVLKKYVTLIPLLNKVQDLNTKDWNKTKGKLFQFIKGFNVNLDNDSALSNGIKILDKFGNVLKKYTNIVSILNDTKDTETKDWNKTKGKLFQFIKGFNVNLGNGSDLAEGYKTLDKFGRVLQRYLSTVETLNGLKDTDTKDWNKVKGKVFQFIKGFNVNLGSGSDLAEGYKTLDKFGRVLQRYSETVNALNTLKETDTKDWNKVKGKVFQFIKGFNINLANGSDLSEGYKTFDNFGRVLKKYHDVVVALNDLKEVDSKDWNKVKGKVFQFIKGFNINLTNGSALSEGIKVFDDVGTYLKRYRDAVSALNELKEVDSKDWDKVKGRVFRFIKGFNINLGNGSPLAAGLKIFDSVGLALKRFSNAVAKLNELGTNADFGVNLAKVSAEIENFINKTALLAKLPYFPDFERVANAVGKFNIKLQDMRKEIEHASKASIHFRSILRQIYTAFVGGSVIYSLVRGIKSAIKEMYDLEYAMARVNTIARVDNDTLKTMTHQVQEMSAAFGLESAKVSKALYDINSATIKGAASIKILQQSAALAVAGFTEIEKVSDLIAKAVNAYEYNVAEATKISDILFVTVERGINPMEELSEYFGRLFTVSANAGVSLEEVGAGLATLTARGYQTNVASTALNSAILKLSTGTKELNKLFQQYGYASSASALRSMGLAGALQVLNKATGGATEKLHDLGFNYRDIRAATTLASGAIDEYNKTLSMMNDKTYTANKTAEALAKVQDTVKFKFDQMKATFTVFIQTISEYANKNAIIKDLLDTISSGLKNVTEAMRGVNLSFKQQLGASLTMFIPKLLAGYGILTLVLPAFNKIKTTVPLITKAFILLKGAFTGVNLSFARFVLFTRPLAVLLNKFILLQGVLEGIVRVTKILDAGTFWSGLSDLTGIGSLLSGNWVDGLIKTPLANFAGLVGSIIDTISGFTTDFGSQWRNAIKPADYQDATAFRKSTQYSYLIAAAQPNMNLPFEELRSLLKDVAIENRISKDVLDEFLHNLARREVSSAVSKAVSELKNFKISEVNYSVEQLDAVYNRVRSEVQVLADAVGLSSEEFNELAKRINDERDGVEKAANEYKNMLPNMKALTDVLSEATKKLEENFEKHAGELQKLTQKMGVAQEAISVIANEMSLSPEEVKSYFSNPVNFEKFKNILGSGLIDFANNINEAIKSELEKTNTAIKSIPPIDFEKAVLENFTDLFGTGSLVNANSELQEIYWSWLKKQNPGITMERHLRETESEQQARFLKNVSMERFAELARTSASLREMLLSSNFIELNREDINKKYVDSARNTALASGFNVMMQSLFNMSSLTEDNKELLKSKQKELRELYNQYYDDPKFLADKIADIIDPANAALRKAVQDAADTFMEAEKSAVKFTKSMVGFGDIVNKLASQKYSISDIIQNQLKLPEVDFFKKQIMRSLGVTEEGSMFDSILGNIVSYMKQGLSEDEMKKGIAGYLKGMGVIDIGLSDKEAFDIVGGILDPIQSMFKLSEEFNKKFKELDFIKFINEMDYGTEISGFEKYKKVGSDLISSLKNIMINVNGMVKGEQGFGTLFDEFRASLESGMSFKDAKQAFIDNYGADAFELFYDKFKEYQGLVKEFVSKVSEADFTKLLNKMQFGGEMNAFKQYRMIDRDKIAGILQRRLTDASDLVFEDAFNELARNKQTLGYTGARLKFKNEHGEEALIQLDNLTKEFESVWSGSSYSLMQSNKNLKKKIHDFMKNFADSFLTPIQQFEKTQSRLNKQLAVIRRQAREGVVNPLRIERALEDIEKLQKLNEETMQMKVPSSITASEAVKTGSKEAFDLVATNIFRDMYKVNVQQKNLQDKLVKQAEKLNQYLTDSNNTLRIVTAP